VDGVWATKSKAVGLIVHTISFQDLHPRWFWSTNVTDRQTHIKQSQDRAMHYSASHGNKKAELSQRWPRDAPYVWVPWKFSGVPDYAHGYFSWNF